MKKRVEIGADKLPAECPRCGSTELCIDNIEGLQCEYCGCWFDTEPDGTVLWARNVRPLELL